eukprot:scaffold148066_cov34-Tisochrysis_lutea.AAC.2
MRSKQHAHCDWEWVTNPVRSANTHSRSLADRAAVVRSPSTATEPLPRDGGVRGWRMARPVDVARDASQQDALQDYNY